jgi:hypothetical protein
MSNYKPISKKLSREERKAFFYALTDSVEEREENLNTCSRKKLVRSIVKGNEILWPTKEGRAIHDVMRKELMDRIEGGRVERVKGRVIAG